MEENTEKKPVRLEQNDHPCFQDAKTLREKNRRYAHNTLVFLWVLLISVVLLSTALHYFSSPVAGTWRSSTFTALHLDPTEPIKLLPDGRIESLSDIDLQWYVGRQQGIALATQFRERDRRIRDLRDKIINQNLLEFTVKFGTGIGVSTQAQGRFTQISAQIGSNNFSEAANNFAGFVQGWTDETRRRVGDKNLFEVIYGLEELARLRNEQVDSLGTNLQPPRMHQIFWSSPIGTLAEVVFWSLMGTLVNLIVNISQARANNSFRTDHMHVIVSKLVYGPVLSFVLILAIYFGLINTGTETRFWLLPILAFLFGYNTRKLAMVIDRLSEKVLGNVTKSIDDGEAWRGAAAENAAANLRLLAKPNTVKEIKALAPKIVHSATVAALLKKSGDQ